MMPINAKFRDMDTLIKGKFEPGQIKKGNSQLSDDGMFIPE